MSALELPLHPIAVRTVCLQGWCVDIWSESWPQRLELRRQRNKGRGKNHIESSMESDKWDLI